MYKRLVNPLKSNSFFLIGARGTGKTTFLEHFLPQSRTLIIDLLDEELLMNYSQNPKEFESHLLSKMGTFDWVIVDEIQKLPSLLNYIHRLIEKKNLKFALTGSSARKLKKEGTNLLAGRAFVYHLYPLSYLEIGDEFNINELIHWGSLPKVQAFKLNQEKIEFLRAYTQTYLKEEIVAEQLVKDLQPFRVFLSVAAQVNTQILNFNKIAQDVNISPITSKKYFDILVDTHLGFYLEPFHLSIRKRQRQNPKFYFFDCGVVRALQRRYTVDVSPQTYEYGKSFEHFIIIEFIKLNEYLRKDFQFSYLRTKDNAEIDLIIERPGKPLAIIEIKSTQNITERFSKSLKNFEKDFPKAHFYLISQDETSKKYGEIRALHWKAALKEIFEL